MKESRSNSQNGSTRGLESLQSVSNTVGAVCAAGMGCPRERRLLYMVLQAIYTIK